VLKEFERKVEEQEVEMRQSTDQIQRLITEISSNRRVLEDSTRDLQSIERTLEELQLKNKDMRASQFEQEKRVKILNSNLLELQEQRDHLEQDYERVKERVAEREIQIVDCEQFLTREQDRDRANNDRRRELMERIDLLS
jgi:chromosome segregation ATPase